MSVLRHRVKCDAPMPCCQPEMYCKEAALPMHVIRLNKVTDVQTLDRLSV